MIADFLQGDTIDTLLFGFMIFCGVLMFLTAVTDRVFFYYKKTPGRGYAQIPKRNFPKWVINIYSNLELVGFLGFCISVGLLAWRVS